LAPELAAAFVSLASDIALVIDDTGVIRNVAVGDTGPAARGWVGRPWAETVTGDTRRKIELLLEEVGHTGIARRREVNHPSPGAPDIPIAYTAIRLGVGGPVLAVGRDLRAVAAIQQRFVDAQQDMEREYWRMRRSQTQRRLIEQVARDAVMVVDAWTFAPLQSNRAASVLFGGLPLPPAILELMVVARSTGRAAEVRARLASGLSIELAATPFRAPSGEHSQRLLLRARPAEAEPAPADAQAVVVTDSAGRVLVSNGAFARLVRGGVPAAGRLLVEALGDPERRLAALLSEVRREGIAEAASLVVGASGTEPITVEVVASLLAEGDQECIGLTLRRHGEPRPAEPLDDTVHGLARGLDDLLGRVGEVPLDDLLLQAARLAERHAIALARRRCGDDRVAAALLGITDDELRERVQGLGIDSPDPN
jgi:transcriptional regulator PpsR